MRDFHGSGVLSLGSLTLLLPDDDLALSVRDDGGDLDLWLGRHCGLWVWFAMAVCDVTMWLKVGWKGDQTLVKGCLSMV